MAFAVYVSRNCNIYTIYCLQCCLIFSGTKKKKEAEAEDQKILEHYTRIPCHCKMYIHFSRCMIFCIGQRMNSSSMTIYHTKKNQKNKKHTRQNRAEGWTKRFLQNGRKGYKRCYPDTGTNKREKKKRDFVKIK